jgi:adenine-specific DNA-methyltransferase
MPELKWVGKDKVVNHHHDVTFKTLKHEYTFNANDNASTNSDGNKIIHGDNLEALKALLPEYEGRVRCIYIDPPYNTGNEGWIYNDNVNDPKIKKWLGQVVGKEGEDLSRHDKWLCMMYPRLSLLRKFLSEDGAIFITTDDNEVANLILIMNEIFGSQNMVPTVIWQKVFASKNSARTFSEHHDYLIIYARDIERWKRNLLPRSAGQTNDYKNPDDDHRGHWTSVALSARNPYSLGIYPIVTPSGRLIEGPPKGRYWSVSFEKFKLLDSDNRIWWGKKKDGIPRLKVFLSEVQEGIVPQTIWFHSEVGNTQEAKKELLAIFSDSVSVFPTPKPLRLIERILRVSADKNSLILDSFAGSGTTAHTVLKLNIEDGGNRKFILIEMMDYAENITAERVRRVMTGYGDDKKRVEGLGGSFDFYEIGEPLFFEDGNLNETVSIEEIRRYVAYTEKLTAEQQIQSYNSHSPYLLGIANNAAYFFYYDTDRITTLDLEFLATLKFKPAASVIYADNCLLSREFMQHHNITFKKIPRDITRF